MPSRPFRIVCACATLLVAAVLPGCAGPAAQLNQPLHMDALGQPDFHGMYGLGRYFSNLSHWVANSADAADSDILLFVAISGGGKRSAAFGHGALRGLRDVALHPPDGRNISLLNALDYISGVSGGSFPAAHYALYRDRSFETFPSEFLYVDVNAYIWGIYLLPWNWAWIFDPLVGTNDYMAQVYDRLMFHGATFADLARVGRPIVSINATDIVNGTAFPFLGVDFGLLCSDLNSFPIARAVAASNGFPGLFGPITLKSYADRCGGKRPLLTTPPEVSPPETEDTAERRRQLARIEAIYADPSQTEWVHLLDGGIADNLALRGLLTFFLSLQSNTDIFTQTALGTRRVLVISVDGEAETPQELGHERSVGGLFQTLSAASGTEIDAYNFETLALTRIHVEHLAERIRNLRCAQARVIYGHPCDDVRGDLVHISLANIADSAVHERLAKIPTGLTIPRQDVDDLVRYGETLVRDNPVIRSVAAEADFVPMNAPPPEPSVAAR
jgi:NTE family protein